MKAEEKAMQKTVQEMAAGVKTSESLVQKVDHKYRAEHQHETYYGSMKVMRPHERRTWWPPRMRRPPRPSPHLGQHSSAPTSPLGRHRREAIEEA
jgi:hypothetical protein